MNYLELSSNLAKSNQLFDFITMSEKIDLDYEMKMMREFTYESVNNINEKLNKYYVNAQKRVLVIFDMLEKALGEIE